ncbi:MAG TPA: DUF2141 domain-containing protein [Novosphingobium sp.]|nr:DUF2141 domain-containing protein [Novosphingobium sp.]
MILPRRFRAAAIPVLVAGVVLLTGAVPSGTAQAQGGAPAGCTGPASQTWLNVVVNGVRSGDGLVAVTLYPDNSRKFLVRHGSMYVGRVDAAAGTTRACIFVPQPGVYAIAVYHDTNANQSFDRTGIGLPAEGYGFSNNPATIAGLPSFRSVRLNVPRAGLTTRIQMKYP